MRAWESSDARSDEPPGETADTSGVAPRQGAAAEGRKGSVLREIIQTLLLAVLVFALVRSVILTYRVDGVSMEPTLAERELLLVNRRAYTHFDLNRALDALPFVHRDKAHVVYLFSPPARGDIVILHPPVPSDQPFVKRIIGLPGEQVAIRNGAVYIDGSPLAEPYLHGVATWGSGIIGPAGITVPQGSVLVLGDNRGNSLDSRAFGTVRIDQIIGKAWISIWPTNKLGLVH